MVERVETGGMMSFDYSKSDHKKLDPKRKRFIGKGYEEYEERRRIEKRNSLIKWIAISLLLILLVLFFV